MSLMTFGILNDLHLGHSGEGRWHNRLLYERSVEIARSAVEVLNSQDLDFVVVLGDLTQTGTPAQLRLARQILSGLSAPWYVLPGNHDRPAVQSGTFDGEFGKSVPNFYRRSDGMGLLFLREEIAADPQQSGYRIGSAQLRHAAEVVEASRPAILIVFSHIPVISERAFAEEHAGKYAGHYSDGTELLAILNALVRTMVIFCAHEHWHHIAEGPGWIQCTTGALIEYPMEVRVVSAANSKLRIESLTASPLADESLDSADWVRGRASDRLFERPLDSL